MDAQEKSRFLVTLLDEIEAWDAEMFPPPWPVAPEEKVLGVAHPYARKFFSMGRYMAREAERQEVEHKYVAHGESCLPIHAQMDEMLNKEKVCMALFFACCCDDLQLWGKKLGVREGWQLVERIQEPPQAKLARFLIGEGLI